jgi:ABC-type glycerol-3-phosphate transport system substrate-binding protein
MMTRTLVGMITLLLTCAAGLAACGGSSGSQTDSAAQAPAQPVCLVPDVVGQS